MSNLDNIRKTKEFVRDRKYLFSRATKLLWRATSLRIVLRFSLLAT